MAKDKNKQVEELEAEEVEPKKSRGFFSKLFLWFIIPVMFLVAVLLVIATLTGTNVIEKGKEIVSELPFVPSEKEKAKDAVKSDDKKVLELQATITEKEAEIAKIQAQLDAQTADHKKLLEEQEKIALETEKLKRNQDETKRDFKDIISTYEKMSAKTSAPAIEKMSDAEALRILVGLKPDTVAKIFEKMTPEKAAKYTQLMAKQ